MKPQCETIQMTAIEQYFHVVLYSEDYSNLGPWVWNGTDERFKILYSHSFKTEFTSYFTHCY